MKAFIVTVIAPDDWAKQDVLIAMNMGMRQHADAQRKDLSGISHHVEVKEEFKLAAPARCS